MFAALALLAAAPQAPTTPAALSPERLQADVRFLACDELGGRAAGGPGAAIAAAWLEARFRRLGLEPLAGAWRHPFPAAPRRIDRAACRLVVTGVGDEPLVVEPGPDLLPHPTAPTGTAVGEIVFAGYGIHAPELGYDDLESVDLHGRVALILRWEPGADDEHSRFAGLTLTPHAELARKIRACQERGAVAVLIAPPPGPAKEADAFGAACWPSFSPYARALEPLVERRLGAREREQGNLTPAGVAAELVASLQASAPLGARVPVATISRRLAEKLVRAGGGDLRRWVRETDEAGLGDGFPLGLRAELSLALEPPARTGWNVAAVLPGADPELRGEFVVVGAHYDHVGRAGDGRIWHGADDNASGVAALLAIAEALAWGSPPPRRSILFLAFDGEELGLLGSSWFLASGLVPPERIAAMLNLDMIGRAVAGRFHVLGSRSSPDLAERVERLAAGLQVRPDFEGEQFFDRSDQAPFYFRRVPVLFFNTDEHADYHRPSDTWEKLDYRAAAGIATLGWRLAAELAATEERPAFVDGYGRLDPRFGAPPEIPTPFPLAFEDRLDY
ncbi:MAG: M28 family peptidase [Planctomycetota bacterium]|nr:MAG: M28 family peptidase [Planctomycetota bacterium]